MAAEEDKKFDAVLNGFLVGGLRVPAGNLHCPESDVLAAYHERSLLPEEMNSWKEHIVGCARCQAVLAELEATDTIPLRASEDASEKQQALPKFPEKSRIVPISRGVRWQWIAPAGALAAGLLVWVAWHENQTLPWKTPAPVKRARQEPPSLPPSPSTPRPAASRPLAQAQADQSASLPKDQAAGGLLSAEETRMPQALKQLEKPEARVKSAPARPSANQERGAREGTANDRMVRSPAEKEPASEPKPGSVGPVTETVVVQTEAANAQTPMQPSPLGAQSAGPRPVAREAEPGKKSKSETLALARHAAAAPSPTDSAAFSDLSASQALMARASDLGLIVAPNKKTLWRAGHAGMIEFSRDSGASWSRQTSNVLVDLTAGFAPSEKVCWIVGRAGTILLTTDAGSHWAVLHSPLEEDLGGVHSTDALHATIWNLGNTKVFETADGGVTWTPAASP
jgi:hypothetical protein